MKIWLVGNLDDSDENMLSYVGVVTISRIISPFSISTYGSLGMCCCSPQSCHLGITRRRPPRAHVLSSNGVVMSATNSSQLILPGAAPNPSSLFFTFFSQVVRRLMLHAWPGVTSGELFHVTHIWRLFFNKELSVLFLVVFECLGCCKQVGRIVKY